MLFLLACYCIIRSRQTLTIQIMPRAKKALILTQPISTGSKGIKVQLDYRTVITLKNLAALDSWRKRYPQAQVIR